MLALKNRDPRLCSRNAKRLSVLHGLLFDSRMLCSDIHCFVSRLLSESEQNPDIGLTKTATMRRKGYYFVYNEPGQV